MMNRMIALTGLALLAVIMATFLHQIDIYRGITAIPVEGFVPQKTDVTCGPAALRYVLAYHGLEVTEEALAAVANVTEKGTSLASLMSVAESYGFTAQAMRIKFSDLSGLALPAIAFIPKWQHYVVIYAFEDIGVKVLDPARGHLFVKHSSLRRLWDGVTLEVHPGFAPQG